MTGHDGAEVPPSCTFAEAFQVELEFDLLDGESREKLPNFILGTQGHVPANLPLRFKLPASSQLLSICSLM